MKFRFAVAGQVDVLLAPLTQVFEVKAVKLYIPSLNCLQKISQSFHLNDVRPLFLISKILGLGGDDLEHVEGGQCDCCGQWSRRNDIDPNTLDPADLPQPSDFAALQGPIRPGMNLNLTFI